MSRAPTAGRPWLLAAGLAAVSLGVGASLWAYGRGVFPCRTGTFGKVPANVTRQINSCGQCHGPQGALNAKAHLDVPRYALDAGESITLTTRATGGIRVAGVETWGGFATEVTAGTLAAGATSQVDAAGTFATHTFAFNGGRAWSYGFTAPTAPGPVEVYTVINTVNGDGTPAGDFWGFVGPDRFDPNNVPVRLFVNAAGVTEIGAGCEGGFETHPVLGARNVPAVGNAAFALELHGAVTGAPVALQVGSRLPAPLDLGVIGVTGCLLHVQPLASLAGTTGPGNPRYGDGSATLPLPIPAQASLAGGKVYAQAVLLDAASPRAQPFALTNALEICVQ